jgi:gamma-glutamyltranspeptidase / glutathione hydrolase
VLFRRFLFVVAISIASTLALAQTDPVATSIPRGAGKNELVTAQNGMVSSQEALATKIGVEILEKGGNAVDAAVAVGFALAVTLPRAGNLGGGGFFVIWLADKQQAVALDFREIAPQAINAKSFLNEAGKPDTTKSQFTGLGVGVPGSVSGLATALEKFGSGKFSLADLIAPAIKYARDGVPVENDLAVSLAQYEKLLARWPSSAKIFMKDGKVLQPGDRLVQPELANTLELIARQGPDAFYRGDVAAKIAASVRAAGGVMTVEDIANYRTEIRDVIRGNYRGYGILSMPPPSSGGGLLVQILNILEGYELGKLGLDSPDALHVMAEAMKRAYADRAQFFGDPQFVKVPLEQLLSKDYAAKQRATIVLDRATPSAQIRAGNAPKKEGDNTTHYSVVDRFGNAVAATVTLNFSYGLGLVAEGTGVLLNNELDDFALAPGVPNAYGLVGGEANAPGPNKKPLSSMSPTILLKDGKVFLVTGSPGGSLIINIVLRVVTGVIDYNLNVADAVALKRFHHQWLPDLIFTEPGQPEDLLEALRARGHTIRVGRNYGGANSILVTPKGITAAADGRYLGALAAGH